jgi:predicted N-acetyltransferase YhbS
MSEEVIIREPTEEDEPAIVDLLVRSFNGWPHLDIEGSPLDYWRWKYRTYCDNRLIRVAEYSGNIVGSVHSVPLSIKLFDETLSVNLGGDVAVDPEYRKLGIWQKILAEINESRRRSGVQYLYNITGNPIVIHLFEKSGEYHIFPLKLVNMVKIHDVNNQLNNFPLKNKFVWVCGYMAASFLNRISNIGRTPYKGRVEVSRITVFDEAYESFWEAVREEHDFIIDRTREYLNWKYLDPRLGGFTALKAEKDGVFLGYLIVRVNRYMQDFPVGYIVDMLTLPGHDEAAHALISEAMKVFRVENVNIINYLTVKGNSQEKIFGLNGFLDSRVNINQYYNLMGNSDLEDKILELLPSRTYVAWGDLDTLPVKLER